MLTLINWIVCDSVSIDSLGKYNCIGIYPKGVIVVNNFLSPINVSFYVEIESEHVGPVPMQFHLEDRLVGRVYQSFDMTLQLGGRASSPIYGGPYPIDAKGPGLIIFSAIAGGQRTDLAWIYLNQRAAAPIALQSLS
jgi:hypothetical protein